MGFEEVELDVLRAGDMPLRQEPAPAEISSRQKIQTKKREKPHEMHDQSMTSSTPDKSNFCYW